MEYKNQASDLKGIIMELFKQMGYKTSLSQCEQYDFLAEKNTDCLAVLVKQSRNLAINTGLTYRLLSNFIDQMKEEDITLVFVTTGLIPEKFKESFPESYNLSIIDIRNLLYLLKEKDGLRYRLLSYLDYSVEQLIPEAPSIYVEEPILLASSDEYWDDMFESGKEIRKLEGLISFLSNKENILGSATRFEIICCDILKLLFVDDLSLWSTQKESNDGLFRFDLICKVKNGNEKEFWRMAEQYFGSKYIVFEFKNYSGKVTQKEVFTTVKYLYAKALRGVSIIISTNGVDEHANKAIRGILREEGKLILSLSNEDLIKMIEMKRDNEDPADYLSKKLDDLLIDLEK